MGYTSYNSDSRQIRAMSMGFASKPIDENFTQNKEKRAHPSMVSRGMAVRVCADSEAHPNTVPIILSLDGTGSMQDIPQHLIAEGLPKLMSSLIQAGVPDASLLFSVIGDHECDREPLQVGQFESGDEELDMWLTRSYIEKGGGSNTGESYMLAWAMAANFTQCDAFTKRGKKGILFTIGDEPCLPMLPDNAYKEIFGVSQGIGTMPSKDILAKCQEKYDVFHIVVNHSYRANNSIPGWKELLGQNCLIADHYSDVPSLIARAILSTQSSNSSVFSDAPKQDTADNTGKIIL